MNERYIHHEVERMTLIRARDLIAAKHPDHRERHLFCDEDAGGNHFFDGGWWEAEAEAVIADINEILERRP